MAKKAGLIDESLWEVVDQTPVRTVTVLEDAGIYTVGELCQHSADEILNLAGVGRIGLARLQADLECYNLSLRNWSERS